MDMLALSGCTQGCNSEEVEELTRMRYAYPWWKEKIINSVIFLPLLQINWHDKGEWNPPPLRFNISHTSSLIACGITMNSSIGIDVEEKNRKTKTNVLELARCFLSPLEVGFLASIPDLEVQHQEFIKLWTLKEAYVKALGKGFSASSFKNFSIHFRALRKSDIGSSKDVDFRVLQLVSGYKFSSPPRRSSLQLVPLCRSSLWPVVDK